MVHMVEHPPVGGDTALASQYGLYDALTDAMKKHLDDLHAVHTSRLQYDTIIDLWVPDQSTAHLRTHPVTGLKELNVNPGFCTGFAELKKNDCGIYEF